MPTPSNIYMDKTFDKKHLTHIARSFVYQFLARCYESPIAEGYLWMTSNETKQVLNAAFDDIWAKGSVLNISGNEFVKRLKSNEWEHFCNQYNSAFGHAARGRCPLNEIEYGDIKADPLFQPHRLADLAAFYRAFGLEIAEDAFERHDHISIECEFMSVLTAKEAYFSAAQSANAELLENCRITQKKFLKEHLGRWIPAFSRRLSDDVHDGLLRSISEFTRIYIEDECKRLGVPPGSQDLFLRVVDDAEESLCASCGIHNLPPGALHTNQQSSYET